MGRKKAIGDGVNPDIQEGAAPEKKQRKNPQLDPRIQAVIDLRRDMVASLTARGMKQSEITKQLGSPTIARKENGEMVNYPNPSYLINPETGLPFDKATINRDVKALRAEWRKSAKLKGEEFFGEQLAAIREVRRKMWAKENEEGVLRSLALEIKLTGSAKPEKKEIEFGEETRKLFTKDDLEDLTDEQLAAIAAGAAGGSG
jgi:hypothetical protein